MLSIQDLTVRHGKSPALSHISLHLKAGSSAAIMGRSGSGKSTLLAAILGMIKPSAGTITVNNTDVCALRGRAHRAYLRSTVSMVFQHAELIDELEPIENITVPALLAGVSEEEATSRAEELLAHFDIPRTGRTTGVLSGGERQRLAVARALATEPSLILADEPTGSLDHEFRDLVAEAIFALPAQCGCALLVVTHDRALASRADSVYELVPAKTGSEMQCVR